MIKPLVQVFLIDELDCHIYGELIKEEAKDKMYAVMIKNEQGFVQTTVIPYQQIRYIRYYEI